MSQALASALIAWPLLAATIAIFGLAVFVEGIAPDGLSQSLDRSALHLFRAGAVICVALSPLMLLRQIAGMAGTAISDTMPFVPEALRGTHEGRLWLWSVPFQIALLVVALAPQHPAWRTRALLGLSVVLLFIRSLGSHAIDAGRVAVLIYFAHEVAASVWFGALLGSCLTYAFSDDSVSQLGWFEPMMARVSRMAGWCVAVMIATGAYNAWRELGLSLDHLLYSVYGITLLFKLACVGIVIAIGGVNRYFLLPHSTDPGRQSALIRNVAIESLLLLGIFGWSALLANTPPAH